MIYVIFVLTVVVLIAVASVVVELLMHEQGGGNSFYTSKQFKNKKILVIVPHEDDEINLAGAAINGFTDAGNEVHVVYYTNGDYEFPAEIRRREALKALSVLGVRANNVHFLGFGDTLINRDGKHIYNCDDNEVVESHCGYNRTYMSTEKNDILYTRANVIKAFEKIIKTIRADIIFAVDLDKHPDHNAVSLFFEDVIGEILSCGNNDYMPLIFKGFAYNMAWNAVPDFYARNLKSCKYKSDYENHTDNSNYDWDARIRFPVNQNCRGWFRFNNHIIKAMLCHKSQKAVRQIARVVNGDQVFWKLQNAAIPYEPDWDIEYIKLKDIDDNYLYRRNVSDKLSYKVEVYPRNTEYNVTLDGKPLNTDTDIPLTYGKHILRAETKNGEYDEVIIYKPVFEWIENAAYRYIKLQHKVYWKIMSILKKD